MNILITGCSTGIGYFCAKKLKQDGYIELLFQAIFFGF